MFQFQVWNGQQAGAAAVLVADNVDEPRSPWIVPRRARAMGIIPSAIERSFGELEVGLEERRRRCCD
ncbi:hypothetical protein Pint_11797 [Pistacia integerrima]|uniref:Uncharacterized protein n=1 Tax=Pistacia integerrima TaxID=434235 RepID=A0ACC0XFT0_9ROSI|nr:hypothetical protein Pint_11797 [Pistacia integerrima]